MWNSFSAGGQVTVGGTNGPGVTSGVGKIESSAITVMLLITSATVMSVLW